MLLPDFQYGLFKDVKSRCRKLVTALARGATWSEMTTGPMIDVADQTGLIVLHGPSPLLSSSPHFHVFLLHMLILDAQAEGRLTLDTVGSIFEQSLASVWSMLALLGQANVMWVYPSERHRPLLEACLHSWNELDGVGPRYSAGAHEGSRLWSLHSNLKYVLANLGVGAQVLSAPLPNGELQSLVAQIQA